jgi:hypothetical protein
MEAAWDVLEDFKDWLEDMIREGRTASLEQVHGKLAELEARYIMGGSH